MNAKQAKQLKNGDKILIEVIFDQIDDDGDAVIEYANSVSDCERGFISPKHIVVGVSETQPNKPKYDPCRLFKKGDRVRIAKYAGRCYTMFWESFVGDEMYVETSETAYSIPEVETSKGLQPIDPAYLELVTPVEELEPYSVRESEVMQGFDIVRDKLCVMAFPFGAKECGWYYNRLAAKEAAEAERDRLNAEHRKEQK